MVMLLFSYHRESQVVLNTTMEFPNYQEVIFQMIITQPANDEIYSFVCTMFTTCVHYVYSLCAMYTPLCVYITPNCTHINWKITT